VKLVSKTLIYIADNAKLTFNLLNVSATFGLSTLS